MAVFFTSDTHFGDMSVIHNCQRPFASTKEMDEALVARWNATVGLRDTIYHLGDFAHSRQDLSCYLDRLNGEIHLVQGNHDKRMPPDQVGRFASVSLMRELVVGGQALILCHYPMREWDGCYGGAWHLHGHVHGRLNHDPLGHSLDVGVDSNDFQPWSFEEIAAILSDRVSPFGGVRQPPVRKTIRAPSPPGNP